MTQILIQQILGDTNLINLINNPNANNNILIKNALKMQIYFTAYN